MTNTMPTPVAGIYFDQFWQYLREGSMHLQRCEACSVSIYPPSPACPHCQSMELNWNPASGNGTIASAARFQRSYLPEYPVPHTVLAVRLQEGPIYVTTMETEAPLSKLMGKPVVIAYRKFDNGGVLPVADPVVDS